MNNTGKPTGKRTAVALLLVLLAVMLLSGCSQSLLSRGKRLVEEGRHESAIDIFYQEIASHPNSNAAWRELGVAFYNKGDLDKAEDALQQANSIQPEARTSLYLGLVNEQRERYDEALSSYRSALAQSPSGKVKKYIDAHLQQLIAKKVEGEVKSALSNEAAIDVSTIPENTVAVVDFDSEDLSAELRAIAKGLAEFTAADLAKVQSLTVVDRMKLDVIQRELELSRSGLVNQATAPRVGRLLGSRHIVTGSLMDLEGQSLRLDGVVVNTVDSTTDLTDPTQGRLEGLFALQKDFVFQILDELGVEVSAAERDAIEDVPTESYLAFLAYCRGLEFERAGRLGDAQREYNSATQQDPGFSAAASRASRVATSMSTGDGGPQTMAQFADVVGQLTSAVSGSSGLEKRLAGTVRGIIGPNINLGGDNPANSPPEVEQGTGTVIIVGDTDAQ